MKCGKCVLLYIGCLFQDKPPAASGVGAPYVNAASCLLLASQLDIAYWHVYYSQLIGPGGSRQGCIPSPEVYFSSLCFEIPSGGAQCESALNPALCAALRNTFDLDMQPANGQVRLSVRNNPLLAVLQVCMCPLPLMLSARGAPALFV